MMLITILICILVQRYLVFGKRIHNLSWFDRYIYSLYNVFGKTALWQGWIGVILVVLPMVIIAGLIDYFLHGWWLNIFAFIFGLIVLFYCLDAHNLKSQLAEYFTVYKSGNEPATIRAAAPFIDGMPATDLPHATRAITRTIFLHADEHIFGVIFWYVVLGPTGALLYFLSAQLVRNANQGNRYVMPFLLQAEKLHILLDWIPVRITGLMYALAGHFSYAFSHWLASLTLGLRNSKELAFISGLEALELDIADATHADIEENVMALGLVDRAIIIWVVLIAIFTLGALLP